jgi:hypothetical protein
MFKRFRGLVALTWLLVALLASPAWASFTFVDSDQAKGTSSSAGIDTTGATVIVIARSYGTSTTPTDSKGNTWTALTAQENSFGITSRLWYCVCCTVGTGHTFNANASDGTITVMAFTSTNAPLFDTENGALHPASGTTFAPGSITPAANDSLVVAAAAGAGGSLTTWTSVTGGGFGTLTEVADNSGGSTIAIGMDYVIQTTAAATNPTFTNDSSGTTFLQAHIASFGEDASPCGGGGPGPTVPKLLLMGVGE